MQCTQLATQTSVIPLNLRLIVHLSSFADNLWEIKKKVVPKVGYELQHGLWGKAFFGIDAGSDMIAHPPWIH